MVQPYRVTIYDTQLDGLFRPGGDAWRWLGGVGTEHLQAAYMFVPRRTSHLANSHYPVPIMTPYAIGGGRGSRYTIRNDADYAEYVHDGTTGFWGANGKMGGADEVHYWEADESGRRDIAYLGPMAPWGGHTLRYAKRVRGQSPNPWIMKAAMFALGPYMGR